MSEQAYNSQMITQYLLGSLPEIDSERFDELSITDDQFAEALKATENDLVDAYAQGELAGAELERFESHYLASPLRREKAGFAEKFQQWSQESSTAQAAGIRPEGREKHTRAGWFAGLGVFSVPRPAWQWGTAFAALALLVVGSWLVFENVRLRQEITQTQTGSGSSGGPDQQPQKAVEEQRAVDERTEQELARARARAENERSAQEKQRIAEEQVAAKQSQPSPGGLSIASFILTPQMRSIGQMTEVSIPPDRNRVVMHLQLEPNKFRVYRVYLLDGTGGKALWRSSPLRARTVEGVKTLDVGMRSATLKLQTYILQVTGVSADGASEIVGDYPFKLVK